MRSEKFRTETGTYTLHVDGDDSSKPLAVFLHGGPGFNSHGERQSLVGRLLSEANVLWLDLLGCGDFERGLAAPYSWQRQVEDVAAAIRHVARGPVHLLAHCTGTLVAHDLVRLDRGMVRSATFYSPLRSLGEVFRTVFRRARETGRIPIETLQPEQAAALERFLATPDEELRREDALRAITIAGAVRDFHELYWIDRVAMSRYLGWMAERPFAPEAFVSLTGDLFERGPAEIPGYEGIPVQLVHSDNDPVTPWETHGLELAKAIPHASTALIPSAGHWLQFERPEEFADETLRILSRLR